MSSFLFVGIGGAFGAMLRFFISRITNKNLLGTWIANITGSLLLAISFRLYLANVITDSIWLLIGVGFCGAFTTFSTFGNEMIQLLLAHKYQTAMIYACTSFFLSLSLVYLALKV